MDDLRSCTFQKNKGEGDAIDSKVLVAKVYKAEKAELHREFILGQKSFGSLFLVEILDWEAT